MKLRVIALSVFLLLITGLTGCEEGGRLTTILLAQTAPTEDAGDVQETAVPEAAGTDAAPAAQETPQAASTAAADDGALLITLLDPQPVSSYAGLPRFVSTDGCFVDFSFFGLPDEQVDCGYVVAPANSSDEGGDTVYLGVVKVRARAENPQPDPLFVTLGGSGESAVALSPFLTAMPWFQEANETRDIVFLDQRGARASAPYLPCAGFGEARRRALLEGRFRDNSPALVAEALSACAEEFAEGGGDLADFNSLQHAADVNAVREALGYEQMNFYGLGDATITGQHLMRGYAQGLRSVILDGVRPLAGNRGQDAALDRQAALDALLAACADDEDCLGRYPTLQQSLDTLYETLEESPAELVPPALSSGETISLPMDGDAMAAVLFSRMAQGDFAALLAALDAAAESGQSDYFATHIANVLDQPGVAALAHFAAICAEDAGFTLSGTGLDEVSPPAAGYSELDARQILAVCEGLGLQTLPAAASEPLASSLPALLLSGELDPLAPPSELSLVLPGLSSAHSAVVPGGAHGQLFSGGSCVAGIFIQFLDNPDGEPDTACLQEMAVDLTDESAPGEAAAACTAVALSDDVVIYQRPDTASEIFSTSFPEEGVQIQARTLDGWLGFDPGVAQAANEGPFRLRWIQNDGRIALSESCATEPISVVEGL